MVASPTQPQTITHELHVIAPGGQGARALLRLLMDAGHHHGLSLQSVRSGTDPQKVRPAHELECGTVRFTGPGRYTMRVTAVLQPDLMDRGGDGLLIVNSRDRINKETVRSVDADGIARELGIPPYLPMLGAIARAVGWTDLEHIKAIVRLALQDTAPYWVAAGLKGLEAGYRSIEGKAAA